MTTLNIIGSGRAGRTLARVFADCGSFEICDVFDRTRANADSAVSFIGRGAAVDALEKMRNADVWMLTPPDDEISAACAALAASAILKRGQIVFHCSGASPSSDLAIARNCGALIASIHPLRSFADPATAAQTFSGTYCAAEGDPEALAVLRPAFERAGAHVSEIDVAYKTVYHASSVIVCNYLTALLEAGILGYERAGFARDVALRMIETLVRETLDNVFKLGPVSALTGPVARGDRSVVQHHVEALAAWDARIAAIYRDLGGVAVDLARAQAKADPEALTAIDHLLSGKDS